RAVTAGGGSARRGAPRAPGPAAPAPPPPPPPGRARRGGRPRAPHPWPPRPILPEGVSAQAGARELERELRLLGPINPLALEEFTELQQRHAFLEEQLDAVRTPRSALALVI